MEDIFRLKFEDLNEEDADETLSFCDLPLSTCDSADFSIERQSFLTLSSSFSTEDTLFEFSSSEYDYPVEDIIFCGKLMSPKREITKGKSQSKSNLINWVKRVDGKSIPPKFDVKESNSADWSKRSPVKQLQSKSNSFMGPAKANQQWPLLRFGSTRIPASKRSSVEKGCSSERKLKREKRLWGLIKALGCGGDYLAVA